MLATLIHVVLIVAAIVVIEILVDDDVPI